MSQTPAAKQAQDKPQPDIAEQAMEMKAEPTREHKWLQKFVGEWRYETEAAMEPGKPPQKMTGNPCERKHSCSRLMLGSTAALTLLYNRWQLRARVSQRPARTGNRAAQSSVARQ